MEMDRGDIVLSRIRGAAAKSWDLGILALDAIAKVGGGLVLAIGRCNRWCSLEQVVVDGITRTKAAVLQHPMDQRG